MARRVTPVTVSVKEIKVQVSNKDVGEGTDPGSLEFPIQRRSEATDGAGWANAQRLRVAPKQHRMRAMPRDRRPGERPEQ